MLKLGVDPDNMLLLT